MRSQSGEEQTSARSLAYRRARHKYSDSTLDIRPRYSYMLTSQSRSVRTPSAEGTLRRRSVGGARGWGDTPRFRAAWASCLPALRPGWEVLPWTGTGDGG